MRRIWDIAAVAFLGTLPLRADAPELYSARPVSPPAQVIRLARIGPDLRLTSPWYAPAGGIAQDPGPPVFDLAEMRPDGQPVDGFATGGYDPACFDTDGDAFSDIPAARWYLGWTYCLPQVVNDLTLDAAYAGGRTGWHGFGFYWFASGAGSSEPCYVITFTAEDFDASGAGPAASNYYDGYVVQLANTDTDGDLAPDALLSTATTGYYAQMVDLTALGGLQLPLDGAGAYHMIFARAYDDTQATLATCAQPMLWGLKPGSPGPDPNDTPAPGTESCWQWDDDSSCTPSATDCQTECTAGADGTFAPGCELRDHTYPGWCPSGPLSAMSTFWLMEAGCQRACADMSCDGTVNAADIPYFVLALTNPAGWQNLVGPECDLICVADIQGDNLFNAADIPYFVDAIVDPNHVCARDR